MKESGVKLLIFFKNCLLKDKQLIKYFERPPMEDILLINSAFFFSGTRRNYCILNHAEYYIVIVIKTDYESSSQIYMFIPRSSRLK